MVGLGKSLDGLVAPMQKRFHIAGKVQRVEPATYSAIGHLKIEQVDQQHPVIDRFKMMFVSHAGQIALQLQFNDHIGALQLYIFNALQPFFE